MAQPRFSPALRAPARTAGACGLPAPRRAGVAPAPGPMDQAPLAGNPVAYMPPGGGCGLPPDMSEGLAYAASVTGTIAVGDSSIALDYSPDRDFHVDCLDVTLTDAQGNLVDGIVTVSFCDRVMLRGVDARGLRPDAECCCHAPFNVKICSSKSVSVQITLDDVAPANGVFVVLTFSGDAARGCCNGAGAPGDDVPPTYAESRDVVIPEAGTSTPEGLEYNYTRDFAITCMSVRAFETNDPTAALPVRSTVAVCDVISLRGVDSAVQQFTTKCCCRAKFVQRLCAKSDISLQFNVAAAPAGGTTVRYTFSGSVAQGCCC